MNDVDLLTMAWELRLPPSSWAGNTAREWTDRDLIAVRALHLYRRSLCPECGHPREVCENSHWAVDTRVCGPAAAVESWRKDNPKPPAGTRVVPSVMTDDALAGTLASAPRWWLEKYRPDLLENEK